MIITALTPAEIVQQVVSILTDGLTTFATAIGSGISQAVSNMFLTADGSALSSYAIFVLVFAAVGLAVGLTTLIFHWLGSLGAKN